MRDEVDYRGGMAVEPTDAVLGAYRDEHWDAYRVDARVSFEHVYLSTDRRGQREMADAASLLADLRAAQGNVDAAALGDPTMPTRRFEDAPLRDVAAQFGDEFAARLGRVPIGEWQGRVESSYGLHVERLDGTYLKLGVEHILLGIDHLLFIAAVPGVIKLARRLPLTPPAWGWRVPPYAIGAVASFWLIERLAGGPPEPPGTASLAVCAA